MVVTVYGFGPAWGLPDTSPFVTKIVYYLTMAKVPFKYVVADPGTVEANAPYGKLPYIVDSNGTKVGDSNRIIEYLEKQYKVFFDNDLTAAERSIALAFDRLINEHLYFSGVIEPRWRLDDGWETYIPYLAQGAEVGPELRQALDSLRARIVAAHNGQGMGRRDSDYVAVLYKADIDALSEFLGGKRFMLGEKVHNIDLSCYAMLRHLVEQPQVWKGTGYVESKNNLVSYMDRMKEALEKTT